MTFRSTYYNNQRGSPFSYGRGNGRHNTTMLNGGPPIGYSNNSRYNAYEDFGGSYNRERRFYSDDYGNHASHRGYNNDDSLSPWESGRPPIKTITKRALLPTPDPHVNRVADNLMSSVNQLFRMGGSEQEFFNIVHSVVNSRGGYNRRGNSNYGNNRSYHGPNQGYYTNNSYNNRPNYPSHSSDYYYDYSYNNRNGTKPKTKQVNAPILTKKKSASKLLPKKTNEKKDGDKDINNIPREALQCHVCNIDNFTSKETYLTHLNGKSHGLVLQVLQSKNNAILQMLRANSKLEQIKQAAQLRRGISPKPKGLKSTKNKTTAVKTGIKGHARIIRAGQTMQFCNTCSCEVAGPMKVHSRSFEHRQVTNFLGEICCGKWYGYRNNSGRNEIDEHKLTLTHLLNVYKEKQTFDSKESKENKEMNEDDLSVEDEVTGAASYLKQLQTDETENRHNRLHSIPPYDSASITGVSCIANKVVFYCGACNIKFSANRSQLKTHCRTSDHYDRVVKLLKKEYEEYLKQKEIVDADLENEDDKTKKGDDDKSDVAIVDLETSTSSIDDDDDDVDDDDDDDDYDDQDDDHHYGGDEDGIIQAREVTELVNEVEKLEISSPSGVTLPVSWSDASEMDLLNGTA